jgi:CRISPR-associated protein Cas1
VRFDEALRSKALAAIHGLRLVAAGGHIPPPLEDSPKCPRCSLVGICLPDEVNYFRHGAVPRPLAVDREPALPVYVQATPGRVRRRGETLVIQTDSEEETTARLIDTSHLVLMGAVDVTAPTLHELMRRQIPVSWYSGGGWFLGHTTGTGHRNVELRTAQYRASFDPAFCLRLARGLVASKLRNGRTLLRRNWRGETAPDTVLGALQRSARAAGEAKDLAELLGIEGNGGAIYFGGFGATLRSEADAVGGFDFRNRNRRPPTDPVNALLSFRRVPLVDEAEPERYGHDGVGVRILLKAEPALLVARLCGPPQPVDDAASLELGKPALHAADTDAGFLRNALKRGVEAPAHVMQKIKGQRVQYENAVAA